MGPVISVQVLLSPEPCDPYSLLAIWSADHPAAAESHFIGRVRPVTGANQQLDALELEHYPGMAERQLQQLATTQAQHHGVKAVLVQHRVGLITPKAAIVLVAVAADRRGPAQRCCQALLEALKHDAPFWKREWSAGVGTWVQGNTPLGDGG